MNFEAGGRLDVGMTLTDSNRRMMQRDREALEAEVVVWAAPYIERLDLQRVVESDAFTARAYFDFSQADAHRIEGTGRRGLTDAEDRTMVCHVRGPVAALRESFPDCGRFESV